MSLPSPSHLGVSKKRALTEARVEFSLQGRLRPFPLPLFKQQLSPIVMNPSRHLVSEPKASYGVWANAQVGHLPVSQPPN